MNRDSDFTEIYKVSESPVAAITPPFVTLLASLTPLELAHPVTCHKVQNQIISIIA